MKSVKDAVSIALAFTREMLQEDAEDFRLEEVEHDDSSWEITLSFVRPRKNASQLAQAVAGIRGLEREYKTVIIDAQTGDVRAMRMRQLT
jgi:hypothetical protein